MASEIEEMKRLENLINNNIDATRSLSKTVQTLTDNLRDIEIHRQYDKELNDKTSKQIEDLTMAINELNQTFANINGKAQGVSVMVKTFWSLGGAILIASIMWLSNTIIELKTQVAVLQSREVRE